MDDQLVANLNRMDDVLTDLLVNVQDLVEYSDAIRTISDPTALCFGADGEKKTLDHSLINSGFRRISHRIDEQIAEADEILLLIKDYVRTGVVVTSPCIAPSHCEAALKFAFQMPRNAHLSLDGPDFDQSHTMWNGPFQYAWEDWLKKYPECASCLSEYIDRIIASVKNELSAARMRIDSDSHVANHITPGVGSQSVESDPLTDGPHPPDRLWIGGESRELEPKAFAMINYMWNRREENLGRKKALVDSVMDSMWGPNQPQSKGTFNNAKTKVNNAFLELNSKLQLREKSGVLILE